MRTLACEGPDSRGTVAPPGYYDEDVRPTAAPVEAGLPGATAAISLLTCDVRAGCHATCPAEGADAVTALHAGPTITARIVPSTGPGARMAIMMRRPDGRPRGRR